ncbi:MAG: hypothetical protein AAF389_14775 [Gemmatimonadota bacterium]
MPFDARKLNGDYPDMGGPDGRWYLAKPIPGPLEWRLRWAWKVITGECDVIYWPKEDR